MLNPRCSTIQASLDMLPKDRQHGLTEAPKSCLGLHCSVATRPYENITYTTTAVIQWDAAEGQTVRPLFPLLLR